MSEIEAIDFYWRQGCGFCMALERGLSRAGIPLEKKNIWEDPDHAAFVRSVADGNETVPTVVVGTAAMVNPRVGEVVDVLRSEAPHLLPDDIDEPRGLTKLTHRLFGDG